MLSNNVHQLLIFGNGFDLHNHINSRFSNFINKKYNTLSNFIIKYYKDLQSNATKYKKLFGKYIFSLIVNKGVKIDKSDPLVNAVDGIDSDKFNYWITCLLLNKINDKPDWADIEKYVYDSIINRSNPQTLINNICSFIFDMAIGEKSKDYNINIYLLTYLILQNCLGLSTSNGFSKFLYKLHTNRCKKQGKIPLELKKWLMGYFRIEMIDFDLSFNDYMVEEFHTSIRPKIPNHQHFNKNGVPRKERISKLYFNDSYKFICKLLKDFVYDHSNSQAFNNNKVPFNVLNFNYTNPLKKFPSNLYVSRHIHGSLLTKYINYVEYGEKGELNNGRDKSYQVRNELIKLKHKKENNNLNRLGFHIWCYEHDRNIPIIGIDGSDIGVQTLGYQFTKTYNILRRNYYGRRGLLPKHIKYIKFFGHSLSKADYSYFEDIFDKYDIFNSSVMLVFYYAQYSIKDKKGAKHKISDIDISLDQLKNISKLFEHYCKVKHLRTNTLLSRLLLEGRLVIRNINSIPKY